MKKKLTLIIGTGLILFYMLGCSSWSKSQKGAAIGAGAGGAVGAGIGKLAGNTALGAIIGASVGGVAGGIIGKQMDKQADEISQIPGAKVQRVGEGINVTFDSGVLFDTNKSNVSIASQSKLAQLGGILNKYPDTFILIEGHTDSEGSNASNKTLSKKRADAVGDYLSTQKVSSSRMRINWYGEEQPKVPNDSPANMATNRRVEFAIYANQELIDQAQKQAGSN